jgi:hypothetical protein
MSAATYIGNEEREIIRRMRREGTPVTEIMILTGRSNTSIHQIVQDVETVMILECGWCSEKFAWRPQKGRPPGYCSADHRYKAALKRKRDARAKESS